MNKAIKDEMTKGGVDWLLLLGRRDSSPDIRYLMGGLTFADPIIAVKRGEEPVFVHEMMESEEAAQSGKRTICRDEIIPRRDLLALPEEERTGAFLGALIKRLKIGGRVLVLGREEPQKSFLVYEELKRSEGIEIAPYGLSSLVKRARETKTPEEADLVRRASRKIVRIFSEIEGYLSRGFLRNGMFHDESGKEASIGDLKEIAARVSAEEGLSRREPPIIAMGRDAASPHMRGNNSMALEAGKTIVADISPSDETTGYFSDMTRTYCLGKAPDRIMSLYRDVKDAYDRAFSLVRAGERLSAPDDAVSDLFRDRGHKTSRDNPGTTEGYVHSLGHGVGLEIHELPSVSHRNRSGFFRPSTTFTIEPGLYYESMEAGIRLEDTFYLDPDGRPENLTAHPMQFEILK